MEARQPRTTRGYGLFEPLLARLRANKANQLISDYHRKGRLLDIGCGSFPYFLSHTYFKEKYAVDQFARPESSEVINWHIQDLNHEQKLPFNDNYFNAVTMLAVVEHLNPSILVLLLQEVYRTLHPGGILIVTTPASWSDGILRKMARFGLVSEEEINEHVYAYTLPLLGWYFGKAGFDMTKLKFGYFELNLNLWATAIK